MEGDHLKRRVASKPPREIPELSKRAQREQRIRLLKQSLPRQTELAHIFATDPEEADKLANYCRQVVDRIAELEEEHKAEIKREDAERHGKVRERAKERTEQKRAATVQGWLNKEFSAEDRTGELSESRSRHRSERRDHLTDQIKERRVHRQKAEVEKTKEIVQSIRAWETNVEKIEERQKEERRKFEYESHSRNLAFEKVQAKLKEAERERMTKMQEDAGDIQYDLELHSWRARQAIQEKKRRAHEAASKTVPKAQVDRDLDRKRWEELKKKEDKHRKNMTTVAEEKEKEQEERQAKHKALAERAQKRLEEKEKEENLKLQKLAEKIRARDHHLETKNHERSKRSKSNAGAREAKIKAFQENSSKQLEVKNAELAQKWADRALRIGEIAGVPASERPDLVKHHAEALAASRRKREDSTNSQPTPHIAAVIKASAEHPAWLSLLVTRRQVKKRDISKSPKRLSKKGPPTEKEAAVLRLQCLRRQVGAKQIVNERKADAIPTKDVAVQRIRDGMRRQDAKKEVEERRSRSSSPVAPGRGRSLVRNQDAAVRLIQSSERQKDAKAEVEVRRAQSRERKQQAGAADMNAEEANTNAGASSSHTASPKDEAARTIQTAERRGAAKKDVDQKRAASVDRKKQEATPSAEGPAPPAADSAAPADAEQRSASPKEDAARYIQSAERVSAAKQETGKRRAASREKKNAAAAAPSIVS